MPTPQAVWPADLTDRRRRALTPAGRLGSAAADIVTLRTALAELLRPRDVAAGDEDTGTWGCVVCDDVITPMWVNVADQEQAPPRAAHQRSARPPGRPTRDDA